jgi:ribokinase
MMKTIVIGSLCTDLVAAGIGEFPKPGAYTYGRELLISPGGKSRNIADMVARLSASNSVAMVARTVQDPYGLWKVPLDALSKTGVNTEYVTVHEYAEAQKLPGIVLIPVDSQGNNKFFVLHGANDDFSIADIDRAIPLFEEVGKNNGTLLVTLESPLHTAMHAVGLAHKYGLRVIVDPGGMRIGSDVSALLKAGIYLIKPNLHEAKMLTGIVVTDFASAKRAAQKLREQGSENILITAGADGAYLFSETEEIHLSVPDVTTSDEKDETGCGDQTIAVLTISLQAGKSLREAAELAIWAGTLQFYKSGIQPITKDELDREIYLSHAF